MKQRVRLGDGHALILALARARNAALANGQRVVAFEVDEDLDALLAASFDQYLRNTNRSGREILGLPVTVGREPGWRVLTSD